MEFSCNEPSLLNAKVGDCLVAGLNSKVGIDALKAAIDESGNKPVTIKALTYITGWNRKQFSISDDALAAYAASSVGRPLTWRHELDGGSVDQGICLDAEVVDLTDGRKGLVQQFKVTGERALASLQLGIKPQFSIRPEKTEKTQIFCSLCGPDGGDLRSLDGECTHYIGSLSKEGEARAVFAGEVEACETAMLHDPAVPGTGLCLSSKTDDDLINRINEIREVKLKADPVALNLNSVTAYPKSKEVAAGSAEAHQEEKVKMEEEVKLQDKEETVEAVLQEAEESVEETLQEALMITSPAAGVLTVLKVSEGDTISEGDELGALETETEELIISSPISGEVLNIYASESAEIIEGQDLFYLMPEEAAEEEEEAEEVAEEEPAAESTYTEKLDSDSTLLLNSPDYAKLQSQVTQLTTLNNELQATVARIEGEKAAENSRRVIRKYRSEGRLMGDERELCELRATVGVELFDRLLSCVPENPAYSTQTLVAGVESKPSEPTTIESYEQLYHAAQALAAESGEPYEKVHARLYNEMMNQ